MAFHWTYRSLPELAGLPKERQRELWRRCSGRAMGRWQVWAVSLPAALLMVAGQSAVLRLVRPAFGTGVAFAAMLVAGLLFSAVYGLVFAAALTHHARPLLRRELGTHCRACDYDLTANASGRCPECGAEVPATAPPGS